jgi:hypothetical protein
MKTTLFPLFALSAALIAPLAADARIVRTVEKSFAVQPGGRLTATTQGGNITIRTSDTPEVRVTARQTIRANSESEADKLLEDLTLDLRQAGNDVTLEAKYANRPKSWFKGWPPVSVDFDVTVPREFNVNGTTSGGNITAESIRGNVVARTSGGNLRFDRVEGELDGRTSGGDITLNEGTARARLSTSGGNIRVDRAGGPTDVSTSGGNIRLNSVAELIRATTSGGNIYAKIDGGIRADTLLSTSGGDVTVTVGKDVAYSLDARTSGGDVEATGIAIRIDSGGIGKSRLAGAVNGGGPALKLRTSGGNITLRAD